MMQPRSTYQQRERRLGQAGVVATARFGQQSRRVRGRRGQTPGNVDLPQIVTAYVDPWSVDADGVRYPDDYRGLTGTFSTVFEQQITTGAAAGTYTDLNMVGVSPTLGSSLFLVTPDPSNMLVQGVIGSNAGGFFGGVPNTFFWPNGILFTNAQNSLNAFGPGTGVINLDNVASNITPLRQLYKAARLVAGGCRITSTMNFSSVSGTVHVAPLFVDMERDTNNGSTGGAPANPIPGQMLNGWQAALPSTLADMLNLPGYMEYPLASLQEDEIVGLFRRSGDEARLFKGLELPWGLDQEIGNSLAVRYGNASIPDNYGHYCIIVAVTGVQNSTGAPAAVSTPILELEIKTHYECQPNPASDIIAFSAAGSAGLTTPSPPSQPLLMAAADNVSVEIPVVRNVDDAGVEELGFIEEVVNIWRNACKVATSVATAVNVATGVLAALAI